MSAHTLLLAAMPFTSGRARFLEEAPGAGQRPRSAKIHVRVRFPGIDATMHGILDTGASWTLVSADLLASLSGDVDVLDEEMRVDTRLGLFRGRLVRTRLVLVADEGNDLELEATLFAADDWSGGVFVGYQGLLQTVRFAIDPMACHFYFGSAGDPV